MESAMTDCLQAVPGKSGKAWCMTAAIIGILVLDVYKKNQTFANIGVNALGYYMPFEDKPNVVSLRGEANYYYVELVRNMAEKSRLYLASPCKADLLVKPSTCECNKFYDSNDISYIRTLTFINFVMEQRLLPVSITFHIHTKF
jgi:hypothetical protein